MKVGKIIFATVLLLATFAGCEWYGTKIPPTHCAYAIFVNFIFLAVSTALMTALELPLFSQSYFAPKRFEQNGRIYRWTGIHAFVTILRLIGWERFWRKKIPVRNDVDALRRFADGTRGSEAVHVVAGVCTLGLSLYIALRYSLVGTKWLWLVNALVNLYPILLQRYNRPRVTDASRETKGALLAPRCLTTPLSTARRLHRPLARSSRRNSHRCPPAEDVSAPNRDFFATARGPSDAS